MTLARLEKHSDRLIVINANAARRGALSPDFYAAIKEACALAQSEPVGAVLIESEGGFFCAGGDLNQLQQRRNATKAERLERIEELHDVIRAIRTCPVPVIAAVEGGAAGAGLSIALACDFVISGQSALFTAAYVKAGLVPDGGLTAALARLVPRAIAAEMCLLGQAVSAERLHSLGVLHRIVPDGFAQAEAHKLADTLCAGPATAQGVIKALVNSAYDVDEAVQMDNERDAMADAIAGAEAAEGIAAFFEKRRPKFSK